MSIISLLLARAFGMDRGDMMDLGVGALLHDIGKIELPARLRNRDDGFTAAETADPFGSGRIRPLIRGRYVFVPRMTRTRAKPPSGAIEP